MIDPALLEMMEHRLAEDDGLLLEPRDQYDQALIGLAHRDGRAVAAYDTERVLDILQDMNGWERDEAMEWFEFNMCIGGMGAPLYLDLMVDLREAA